jgi:hypothetical protein
MLVAGVRRSSSWYVIGSRRSRWPEVVGIILSVCEVIGIILSVSDMHERRSVLMPERRSVWMRVVRVLLLNEIW